MNYTFCFRSGAYWSHTNERAKEESGIVTIRKFSNLTGKMSAKDQAEIKELSTKLLKELPRVDTRGRK